MQERPGQEVAPREAEYNALSEQMGQPYVRFPALLAPCIDLPLVIHLGWGAAPESNRKREPKNSAPVSFSW